MPRSASQSTLGRCFGRSLIRSDRFIDCEKWRKEFGTDDLPNTFEYTEKPRVFEYYPQYYHKTDKVSPSLSLSHKTCAN